MKSLSETICPRPLSPADYQSIYAALLTATPRVARALSLLMLADQYRHKGEGSNRRQRRERRAKAGIGSQPVKPGLGC